MELRRGGVRTVGNVWRLCGYVYVPAIRPVKPGIIDLHESQLHTDGIEQILTLCDFIEDDYRTLAAQIKNFVKHVQEESISSYQRIMIVMARNVVRWIQHGHPVPLAYWQVVKNVMACSLWIMRQASALPHGNLVSGPIR